MVLVALLVAPSTMALGFRYVPEVHRGIVGGGVPPVSYPLSVALNERIVVAVQVLGRDLMVRLFDPSGLQREAMVPIGAERLEMNADKAGVWRVQLSGPAATAVDYALTMGIVPNQPYGVDEGLEFGDAPGSCPGGHLARTGVWLGGLWGADAVDVYRFRASLGDAIVAVLKPDDLDDGADFSLELLDASCVRLDGENVDTAIAKSIPDEVTEAPARRTGDYYLRVARVNGVGNYQLSLTVGEVFPTLPGNDAGANRDSTGAGDAIPVSVPSLNQAHFHDGDPSDWYRMGRSPDTIIRFVVEPSLFSTVELRVYDMSMRMLYGGVIGNGPRVLDIAYDDGPVYLEVVRWTGGGNYFMGVYERPVGT